MQDLEIAARSARKRIISAIYNAKKGHLGGALSSTDVLVWLYSTDNITTAIPGHSSDRPLILSKGHSATALLAVIDEVKGLDQLAQFNFNGALVGNNPSELVHGVEFHTGSLGHGAGLAAGVALAKSYQDDKQPVIVLMSDGECNEGSVWEAVQFITAHQLNVCILIDSNGQICEDFIEDASYVVEPDNVFKGFGFETFRIDGHDFKELSQLDGIINNFDKPRVCFLNTIKGKGVSFMERQTRWHHSIPTDEEFEEAMKELS